MDAAAHHLVVDRTLTRRNIEAAITAATMPVRLVDCDLEAVDLSRLDLTSFVFERCVLKDADLSHATAVGTTWIGCRARSVEARGIDLTDAVLKGGDWNNVRFDGSLLAGTSFTGVKLTGSSFMDAKSLGATFEECLMASCVLPRFSFRRSRLGRCDMTSADLRECDFREAVFDAGSSLTGANIADARFDGADLRQAELGGHGLDALRVLAGARISIAQAAGIVSSAGLKVG